MDILKIYSRHEVLGLTRKRGGEEKIGERVQTVEKDWRKEVAASNAKFVLLGIPEDIGVRANYGRAGANTAFRPALDSFLSQQSNSYLNGGDILVLGEIYVEDLMESSAGLDVRNKEQLAAMRQLVARLDERVSEVVKLLVSYGKIPVIIGGGHNNAYGNIKGAATAIKGKLSVINCDPHLDFRPLEGRHSGNGFSYAFEEGYVERYAVFAIHEQYNNSVSLRQFSSNAQRLFCNTYESVFVREEITMKAALSDCLNFVSGLPCGIELDLDAITNVPSSAKTSSGISPVQARQYIHHCATHLDPVYLHIAEGAPVLSHIKADNKTGKLIAYLVSDFIKGFQKRPELSH